MTSSALKINPKVLAMQARLNRRGSLPPLCPCLLHHSPFQCIPAPLPAYFLSSQHAGSFPSQVSARPALAAWNALPLEHGMAPSRHFGFSSNSTSSVKPQLLFWVILSTFIWSTFFMAPVTNWNYLNCVFTDKSTTVIPFNCNQASWGQRLCLVFPSSSCLTHNWLFNSS